MTYVSGAGTGLIVTQLGGTGGKATSGSMGVLWERVETNVMTMAVVLFGDVSFLFEECCQLPLNVGQSTSEFLSAPRKFAQTTGLAHNTLVYTRAIFGCDY